MAIKALVARNPGVRWEELDDAILGCANQAGEDNRNVARMATLLAGLPIEVPGATVNRLCGSGLDAIGGAARAIRAGEAGLMLAGGVESMSRAPFVMGKADSAYSRSAAIYDTTIGWRFINKLMKAQYGVDSMPETAERGRRLQDQPRRPGSVRAGQPAKDRPRAEGRLLRRRNRARVDRAEERRSHHRLQDEHPRETTLEALAKLKGVVREGGSVTAGNASGVNDGAAALLLADERLLPATA